MALRDQYVPFRREDFIADVALSWRRIARNENLPYFDIVAFVERVLQQEWVKKGHLHIEFFDAPENAKDEELARVEFRPRLELHIDRETWRLAEQGEPRARFIVAHEVGHIILHQDDAKHFSNDPRLQTKAAKIDDQEHSAEWQANTFASYFLLTDRVLESYDSLEDIIAKTSVNEPFVLRRHKNAQTCSIRRQTRHGGLCDACGNFTVTSDGVCQSDECKASCG
jgi:hypothetical protein